MKIAIAGIGYVGLSLSVLLSQTNEVYAFDIDKEKVNKINKKISTIKDKYIEKFLREKDLNLTATDNYIDAFQGANYIIISTPTNYDEQKNFFDTSSVEDIIKKVIMLNDKNITIVIKSTVPVGFVDKIKEKYKIKNIFFSPEFLREGKALYDNLYPSRIIIGEKNDSARKFASLLVKACRKKNVQVLYMNSREAEAVKLFSNTYLALRVAYFNELDTYAISKGMNSKDIISGVVLDPRIGNCYNNPSFGYGGYCLPKDSKQLLANYENIPQNIIEAIVKSNNTRKEFIAKEILKRNVSVVGIYRLTMKTESDNFRESAIHDIIDILKSSNKKIIIYEPTLNCDTFKECEIVNNIEIFKQISSIIVANRIDKELKDVRTKVYSRDLFKRD